MQKGSPQAGEPCSNADTMSAKLAAVITLQIQRAERKQPCCPSGCEGENPAGCTVPGSQEMQAKGLASGGLYLC